MTDRAADTLTSPIRVLVVDDQKMMRTIFKDYTDSVPDITVVGTATNGKEGVERAFALQPDVVLMDIEMPEMDGISATRMLKSRRSSAKVLVISTSYDDRYLAQALRHGACGYLLKTTSPDELVSAIRGVHAGSLQFGSGVLQRELSTLAPGGIPSEPDKKVQMPVRPVQNTPPARIVRTEANGLAARAAATNGHSTNSDRDGGVALASPQTPASPQPPSPTSRELETELSRIRAAYWVLKTDQQKMRRWLEIVSFIGAGALAVLFILVCLVLVV